LGARQVNTFPFQEKECMMQPNILRTAVFIGWMLLLNQLVLAQDSSGKAIDATAFEQKMKKRKTVLLDVRTSVEYNEGHISGAVNADVTDSTLFTNWINGQNRKTKYLLYCRSGKRSGKALVIMQEAGYRKLYHLNGGITAWKGALTQKR
jgi:rhodanese-related sulfurtransferase